MSGARQKHARSIPGACQEHARSKPGACQQHARSRPGACQEHASCMPGAYQNHARGTSGARQERATILTGPCSLNRARAWSLRMPLWAEYVASQAGQTSTIPSKCFWTTTSSVQCQPELRYTPKRLRVHLRRKTGGVGAGARARSSGTRTLFHCQRLMKLCPPGSRRPWRSICRT